MYVNEFQEISRIFINDMKYMFATLEWWTSNEFWCVSMKFNELFLQYWHFAKQRNDSINFNDFQWITMILKLYGTFSLGGWSKIQWVWQCPWEQFGTKGDKVWRMLWERAQDEKGKRRAQTGPARSLFLHTAANTSIILTGLSKHIGSWRNLL